MSSLAEQTNANRSHTPARSRPAASAAAAGHLVQRRAVRGAESVTQVPSATAQSIPDFDMSRNPRHGGPQRIIQTKLMVTDAHDASEHEADSVAQKVVAMPEPVAHQDGAAPGIAPVTHGAVQTKNVQCTDAGGTAAPPVAHDALNSSGQPLDTGTRGFMEPRFGWDFGNVRIHTDTTSAVAARSMQARAFTSGRDIVFGEGQYSPGTAEGKSLLAHELTHVVQQGAAGRTSPGNGTIQRKFLGGILGAIGGAIIGALVGGPIGAIVGAIGGALIGDRITQRRRSLTAEEKANGKEIFRDTVDYSKIVITRDSLLSAGAPKTIGNTIHLKSTWGEFEGNTMDLSARGKLDLIHEMGHVWQYQNGGLAYIPKSLWAQFKAAIGSGSRNGAYGWEDAHKAGIPWEKWNPEQQASAIEEYNRILPASKLPNPSTEIVAEMAILMPYMQKVWNRECAPHFF